MEAVEDIVILGAGIAGLATCLGLHRLGIRSLVLESGDRLRTTGFAFCMWTNAWRAIDALGIGDSLRAKHNQISSIVTISVNSGLTTSEMPFATVDQQLGLRCMNRNVLLETLESELPKGTVRYSSKVVNIEDNGLFKSIHLADGTILKTKVLIGCDGVNSVVAKFLGFSNPSFAGRSAVRGLVHFEDGHCFETKMIRFFGKGVRYGIIPCDDRTVYWFFTFTPSPQEKEIQEDPNKVKQFVLSKLGKVSDEMRAVIENTELDNMVCLPLRFRHPWEMLWGNISKGNICVAGDALHPMTPDLAQGGCSALEDAVVLARALAEALKGKDEKNEQWRIRKGLEKYAKERRWRSFELISTAFLVGFMQQSDGVVMNFLRDKLMAKFLAALVLKKTRFDCGDLTVS